MHTNIKAVLCFLLASFLGAMGQYLYKTGSTFVTANVFSWISNVRILLGIICYCLVMFLFVFAFKFGGEFSVLYPIYATTFIWGAVIAVLFLNESLSLSKVIGMLTIMLGVYLIAK